MPTPTVAIAALSELGFLAVRGEDAEQFLQAQLSQDMGIVTPSRSALAAWHDAKGRVRALFRVLRLPERFVLATAAESVPALLAALPRYILRARAQVEALPDWCGLAVLGHADVWLAERIASRPTADGAVAAAGEVVCVRIDAQLHHLYGPAEALAALDATPTRPAADAAAAEIRLGLPTVPPAVAAEYVPHMLNLDALGALAFDKGCYPGQEVIARTQHLGTVKRRARAFRAAAAAAPDPGTAITDASGATVGHVVRSASTDAELDVLAVVPLEGLGEPLFLEQTGGQRLPLEALPFERSF